MDAIVKRQQERLKKRRKKRRARRRREEDIMVGVIAQQMQQNYAACLMMAAEEKSSSGRQPGAATVKRERRNIDEHFASLGPYLFRRMYRMHRDDFDQLYELLLPALPPMKNRSRGTTPNGAICMRTRLAMALRYFAGGDRLDIAATHVVHPDEVYKSVWIVIDAIHMTTSMNIEFPADHDKQQQLADEFAATSKANITQCCAAVDGMLIWTHMPSEKMDEMRLGSLKFYDGRKKKFGLTMQGTCDVKGRFLDIYIAHPGSAGDFTVWLDSPLRQNQIEQPGFLKKGLVLFGDNAYINTTYTVTPFKGATSDPQDDFNYYHSNLRINIERAFGMLVHRWGCLRKPMPMNLGTPKISRIVLALCKLHNFLIDRNHTDVAPTYQNDASSIFKAGGFEASSYDDEILVSTLINRPGTGDDDRSTRREHQAEAGRFEDLPIFTIFNHVKNNNYTRPKPVPREL
jgi:hypothetical protein